MKKFLSVAVAAAAMSTSAMAANMENPLFLPHSGQVYSKTSIGLMYKKTDDTKNQVMNDHNGAKEFPIWRPSQELGIGITDRWAVHAIAGYTYNPDIDRKGFHLGRFGTTVRVIDSFDGFVWDLYGDFHLGGMEKMKGALTLTSAGKPVFKYANFSNGRWGYHFGTKFGKKWSEWTMSAFVEGLQTFGNHNNKINVAALRPLLNSMHPGAGALLPDDLSVDIKSTWEINAGANLFYQIDSRWSAGLGFRYNYHATNGLESVYTALPAAIETPINAMLQEYKDMHDHFNEYIWNFTVAYQMHDSAQIAWYIEDTYDTGAYLSSNTTDLKLETGFRLNLVF